MTRPSTSIPTVSRRNFFKVGMAGASAFYLEPMLRPLNASTTAKVKLRAAADFCIFVFLNGGASQLDTFDIKEGNWTPQDSRCSDGKNWHRNAARVIPEHHWEAGQSRNPTLGGSMGDAHARAQYYLQVGHSSARPAGRRCLPSVRLSQASSSHGERLVTFFRLS